MGYNLGVRGYKFYVKMVIGVKILSVTWAMVKGIGARECSNYIFIEISN
jgi:hypothetical protein